MTTRFRTAEDVQRLFDAQIPESTSLEYKRALELGNQGQRLEALKDLTGMANGGGGTVLYGVAETSGEHPVPEELCPLEDLRLVGILEDIVRSAVRPPLLVDYARIPVEGGFVLAMDLEPSPLGPHMIEAYGEARYYQRTLTRTAPMSEQQVRDAYALAVRGRERRPGLWAERELPMPAPSTTPWLAVSALPEEPLREIFDVTSVDPSDLRPPEPIASHTGLTTSSALQHLARWAQGYFGEEHSSDSQATEIVRIHRDGSAAIGTQMPARVTGLFLARKLNGVLAYLSWLWRKFGLRRPVEIETTLWNIGSLMLNRASLFGEDRSVHEPVGVPIHKASARDGFVVSDLQRASVRHRAVQKFVDIVYQSFGLPFCEPLFRSGQLYGSAGTPLGFSVAGKGIWRQQPTPAAIVYDDTSIRHLRSDVEVIGHLIDGVIIDTAGDTLAVIEMAPGVACPDDFLPVEILEDPRAHVPGGNPGKPHPAGGSTYPPPPPTSRWSNQDLAGLLADNRQ